jgi:hypothetical protein
MGSLQETYGVIFCDYDKIFLPGGAMINDFHIGYSELKKNSHYRCYLQYLCNFIPHTFQIIKFVLHFFIFQTYK